MGDREQSNDPKGSSRGGKDTAPEPIPMTRSKSFEKLSTLLVQGLQKRQKTAQPPVPLPPGASKTDIAYTTVSAAEDRANSKSSSALRQKILTQTNETSATWQWQTRSMTVTLKGVKQTDWEDPEAFITVRVGDTDAKSTLPMKLVDFQQDPQTLVFVLWDCPERATQAFKESIDGIEVSIYRPNRIRRPELFASCFLPISWLKIDHKDQELCIPLMGRGNFMFSNPHTWDEPGDEMSPRSVCATCGQLLIYHGACCLCKACGQYVHEGCRDEVTASCRPFKGYIDIVYNGRDEHILSLSAYQPLLKTVLIEENADVLAYLVKQAPQEDRKEILVSLIRIFENCSTPTKNYASRFLSRVAQNEIHNPKITVSTLFRGNSIASKSVDAYMHQIGDEYLHELLCPVLTGLVSESPNCEVQPNKLEDPAQEGDNRARLVLWISKILSRMITADVPFPKPLTELFRNMRNDVRARFPESPDAEYIVVNGFLFLRFIVPALICPKQHGLLLATEEVDIRANSRVLTLISKVVQNVANRVHFGSKEAYMTPLNPMIDAFGSPIKDYVDRACGMDIPVPACPPQIMAPNSPPVEAKLTRMKSESTSTKTNVSRSASLKERVMVMRKMSHRETSPSTGSHVIASLYTPEMDQLLKEYATTCNEQCKCSERKKKRDTRPLPGEGKIKSLGTLGYELCRALSTLTRLVVPLKGCVNAAQDEELPPEVLTRLHHIFGVLERQESRRPRTPTLGSKPVQREPTTPAMPIINGPTVTFGNISTGSLPTVQPTTLQGNNNTDLPSLPEGEGDFTTSVDQFDITQLRESLSVATEEEGQHSHLPKMATTIPGLYDPDVDSVGEDGGGGGASGEHSLVDVSQSKGGNRGGVLRVVGEEMVETTP
eukprot:comp22727_c1_seq1/m.35357 comp22727_c1_seq1/g.35357  ORF comp22727_c1_seq1/g.35357 comp22727_c1_seq1/m.35357 type:complete len:888 (-) comp22727_c1_seq1:9-2672(-)